jgi:guanylate kinase
VIIVISGPGGVGKGTVVSRLVARDPRLWLSRSWTTRQRRPREPADAYTFVDRDTFERHINDGGFLEHAEFLDQLMGTPYPDLKPDTDLLLEIDVQGAAQVRGREPDALLIFLTAPSPAAQAERLRKRGDSPERIEQRLRHTAAEAEAAERLGARFVINDDLDVTVDELAAIIDRARKGGSDG